MKPNPWGLVASECETLSALIECGNSKKAGVLLNLKARTVENRGQSAREKMQKVLGTPISRLQAAVLFDRHTRDEA